jgi:hypothetical protein
MISKQHVTAEESNISPYPPERREGRYRDATLGPGRFLRYYKSYHDYHSLMLRNQHTSRRLHDTFLTFAQKLHSSLDGLLSSDLIISDVPPWACGCPTHLPAMQTSFRRCVPRVSMLGAFQVVNSAI